MQNFLIMFSTYISIHLICPFSFRIVMDTLWSQRRVRFGHLLGGNISNALNTFINGIKRTLIKF